MFSLAVPRHVIKIILNFNSSNCRYVLFLEKRGLKVEYLALKKRKRVSLCLQLFQDKFKLDMCWKQYTGFNGKVELLYLQHGKFLTIVIFTL